MKNKLVLFTFLLIINFTYPKNEAFDWVEYGNQWAQWGSSWNNPSTIPISPRIPVNHTTGFSSQDDQNYVINGCGSFKGETLEKSLTVNGTASFDKVKTQKEIIVHVTAIIKNSTLENITLFGYLEAYNTILAHATLYTTEGVFKDSTLSGNLLVVHNEHEHASPEIKLINTTINGDVEFKGKQGTVILSDTSTVKGKVINGLIIQK